MSSLTPNLSAPARMGASRKAIHGRGVNYGIMPHISSMKKKCIENGILPRRSAVMLGGACVDVCPFDWPKGVEP